MSEEAIVCPMCLERVPPEYIICPYCGYDLTQQIYEAAVGALGIRGIARRIYQVIREPRIAMKDVADHPDRFGGILIMLAFSIFLVLGWGPAYLLRSGTLGIVGIITSLPYMILGGFVLFIIPLLMWYLGSAIFWLIAKMLGGRGVNYAQTQSVVGYGLVPLALWSMISMPILFIGLPGGVSAITMANSGVESFLTYLMVAAFIWSVILIGLGLTRAHLFSKYEGMVIAALPIIGLLFVIIS